MVSAAVCSNAMALLFLIHCLLLLPLFVWVWFLVNILLCCTYCTILFFNHLAEEERVGFFTLTVFLLTYGYKCSVPLPNIAVSWSALSDCGISWSYSLTLWSFLVYYNQNKSILLCKLVHCLSVHSNSELSLNNYCYSISIFI